MKISELLGDFSMAGSRRIEAPGNFRADASIRGSRDNILSDEQDYITDQEILQKAVVLYLRRGDKFLSVSLGKNTNDVNMPGGGVEPSESTIDAARRELWEETGLRADDLFPVHRFVRDGKDVTVFYVKSYGGKIRSSEEGIAGWETADRLRDSTYGDTFVDVLERISGLSSIQESCFIGSI